jgi:glycerate-2-kinase
MQGWISLAHGEKQPAPVVEYHARAREATFVTVLGAGQAAYAPIAVRQSPAGDGTHVVICSSHVQHDVVVPAVARTDHPVTDVRGAC